jgi:hypothetical protein
MISSVDIESEDSSLNRQVSINRMRRLPPHCHRQFVDAPISTGATDSTGFGTLALRLLNESLARLAAMVPQVRCAAHSLAALFGRQLI